LVPRKGQDRLIDALALLAPEFPHLELALIGGGRLDRALARRARRRGVAERVRLLGALGPEELAGWFAAADVFASPCRTRWGGLEVEGFGIVFAEAALAGLPVMAGRSGGAPEAVVPGDSGIVVDGSSTHEVAEGLARLLRLRAAERRRLGEAGRALALRRHSPQEVGRRYRCLLRSVASG
jgi:phosphatidylinositol alpha-1,6-mannosyltransferase